MIKDKLNTDDLVSVIIPVYNAENYIIETIQSVLDQTYTNWELIIINDGSSDTTEELIKPFLKDKRVCYYSQNNTGVSTARNNGMAKSKGEFIALLDADDTWENNNLELKIAFLKNNKEYNWIFSDYHIMDKDSMVYQYGPEGTDIEILKKLFLWDGEVIPVPCSNLIFSKLCYESGIRFDPKLSTTADRCFTVQLAEKYKGKRLAVSLVHYRVLSGSMSKNMPVTEKDNLYFYSKYSKQGLISPLFFRLKCYSNIYLILAGSWVANKNKIRGTYFLIKSILFYPPHIINNLKKAFNYLLSK